MFRRRAKPLLGTLVEIGASAATLEQADAAINAAFAEIALIHSLMSFHQPDSALSRINASPVGAKLALDPHCACVLQAAQAAAQESGHAFDCTVATELVAGGLLPGASGNLPMFSEAACWQITEIEFIKLAPCLLDLGGIAKGYAVDRAVAILQEHGCQEALVNAGGDMRHVGSTPVIIHLRAADDPASLPLAVSLHNQALASSTAGGLDADGPGRQSAIFNGKTRRPLGLGASASVMAQACMDADLLTKVVLASDNPRHPMLARRDAQVIQYCNAPAWPA